MTTPRTFEVDSGLAGERLDAALASLLGETRSRTVSRVKRGEVTVNGRAAVKSSRLETGDVIGVGAEPEVATGGDGVEVPPIRYEDEHLLIVAKPPGLIVHPGVGNPSGTLVQVLQDAGIPLAPSEDPVRPGVVHRLDKDTSGVLVLAKTTAALDGLQAALKRRDVERRYLTLVDGGLGADRGRVEGPIGRDPRERKRFAVVEDGKPAVTHWDVRARGAVAVGRAVTLIGCRLETGRTHQIRVHLRYAGHPVCGDSVYGASAASTSDLGLTRPFLHAATLGFTHPVTGAAVRVVEPLPADLVAAAELAGPAVAAAARSATDLATDVSTDSSAASDTGPER